MRREEQPRQRVLFTEGSLRDEGVGGPSARAPSPILPASRPPPVSLRISPPQDQPLCNGPLRVAVKPRQRLVRGVLRKDTVGGLGEGNHYFVAGRLPERPRRGTHLVQEAEPLEGLAVLHRPSHLRRSSTSHATVRRSRPSGSPASGARARPPGKCGSWAREPLFEILTLAPPCGLTDSSCL